MDTTIGVNLRVTAHSSQGGRKYMEDMLCVAYQPTADEKDLLYAFFGIFDGHGGREAAMYTKEHLMDNIVSQKNFWAKDDDSVLKAIHDGFVNTHYAMRKELEHWPKTPSGLLSTSGTTASIAFVRRSKLYMGHVGDSAIILGFQDPQSGYWRAKPLTREHKPESMDENARITQCGGKVVRKSGVPRVVWNRPRLGHKGPVRRSTPIDEIPFLAVARSLGDFWSYNSNQNEFVVSPEPDVSVVEIDISSFRCLIFASDGLWNMLNAQEAVNSVYFAEKNNERQLLASPPETVTSQVKNWINPSKRLVDRALDRWYHHNLRADNTSVVTVVIDPPGPPKSQVVRANYKHYMSQRTVSVESESAASDGKAVTPNSAPKLNDGVHGKVGGGKSTPGKISGQPSLRPTNSGQKRPKSDGNVDSAVQPSNPLVPQSPPLNSATRNPLISQRKVTSPPSLSLKPPVIVSSVRSCSPDRPVWRERKRERTSGKASGVNQDSPVSLPQKDNNNETDPKETSNATGVSVKNALVQYEPTYHSVLSAKRRKKKIEEPETSSTESKLDAVTTTAEQRGQRVPPTNEPPAPKVITPVQINEISSSSESTSQNRLDSDSTTPRKRNTKKSPSGSKKKSSQKRVLSYVEVRRTRRSAPILPIEGALKFSKETAIEKAPKVSSTKEPVRPKSARKASDSQAALSLTTSSLRTSVVKLRSGSMEKKTPKASPVPSNTKVKTLRRRSAQKLVSGARSLRSQSTPKSYRVTRSMGKP